jgi:uncharacterized protein involved in exopolysaccharide biosynthesis
MQLSTRIIDPAEPALRPANVKAPAIALAILVSAFLGLSGVVLLFLARRAAKRSSRPTFNFGL